MLGLRDGGADSYRGRRPLAADQAAEAKEGVARGGAQPKLRDDEVTGPMTHTFGGVNRLDEAVLSARSLWKS